MKEYIVTVMARDRVGIVRDLSTALADLGGNLTHVSQTVMRGYFTLIVSAQMPDDRTELEIRQAIERKGEVGELAVSIKPYEVPVPCEHCPVERFILTIRVNDRPGITSRVTTYLAERDINIDDFYASSLDGKFVMQVEVSIPVGTDLEEIQTGLQRLEQEYDSVVHLQHENIFRAMGEVRPVMDLES